MQGGDTPITQGASLPNITGSIRYSSGDALDVADGALNIKTASSAWNFSSANSQNNKRILEFDASLSNEIYGKSDKVLPENITLIAQIKY